MPTSFDILSVYPELCESFFGQGIIGKARQKGLIDLCAHQLRDWAEGESGKRRQVDDYPFGGGPGMILKAGPLCRAVDEIRRLRGDNLFVIFLSPRGRKFKQKVAVEFAQKQKILLVSGHYEGYDQRAADLCADMELSLGDYVLSNGVLAAMCVIDATARLLPGVLGNPSSVGDDSFRDEFLAEAPQYTRPQVFRSLPTPEVLLSGNHAEIASWRRRNMKLVD